MSKKLQVERRFFQTTDIELREGEDGNPSIKGIATPFGKESHNMGFVEVMKRGAFKNALDGSDAVALFNHDANFVLGRESNRTLKVHEGRDGLVAEIDPPQTNLIQDMVVSPVKRGDVRGMSIGFVVEEGGDEFKRKKDGTVVRTIKEVRSLVDISVVTFPAYPDTRVAVRSLDEWLKNNPEEEPEGESTGDEELAERQRLDGEKRNRNFELRKKQLSMEE